ncbi:MAG: flippase-like domain-containing protein [Acidimicrobiia bacterium]|nr:flippase-like domain-containing protein [Acidimicrobiia bacterium]
MSDRIRRLLVLASVVVVLALMGAFVARNWDRFRDLEISQPWLVAPLLLAIGANLFFNGWLMASVLRPLGIDLSKQEAFALAALNRLGNYVAPMRLGASVRIVYLKKTYGLGVSRFLASMSATYLIQYSTLSVFGLIGLSWLTVTGRTSWNLLGWGFLAALTLLSALALWPLVGKEPPDGAGLIRRAIARFLDGWATIRSGRGDLGRAVVWALATYLSFALMTYLEFRILGIEITPFGAAFVTSVGALTGLIGITPAGLGVSEGLIVLAASSIGLPAVAAFAAAILQRLAVFGFVSAVAPFASRTLARHSTSVDAVPSAE